MCSHDGHSWLLDLGEHCLQRQTLVLASSMQAWATQVAVEPAPVPPAQRHLRSLAVEGVWEQQCREADVRTANMSSAEQPGPTAGGGGPDKCSFSARTHGASWGRRR